MSQLLSQEEMNTLLSSGLGRRNDAGAEVVRYNFRRPDRVAKEQLRSLHFLHDRFALNVSTSLSAFLRAMTEVTILSVEQFSYSEFLMSLPDPTAIYAIGLHPLDGLGALEINPAVAFTMVDRLLGGTGHSAAPNRPLTEIEQNVLDAVVKLLLENLTETWRPITDVQFRIQGSETRPQMLQVIGPNEVVILLVFNVRLGDVQGLLHMCIPATAIETLGEKFVQGWHRRRRQPTSSEEAWLHANLGRVPLPVTTVLETPLPARELLALEPGDIIAIGHHASSPVDVHVGQVARFAGQLASVDNSIKVIIQSAHDQQHDKEGTL